MSYSFYSFVGELYQQGDTVCFLKNVTTGSNTRRKKQFIGKVLYTNGKKTELVTADGTKFTVTKAEDIICRVDKKRYEKEYIAALSDGGIRDNEEDYLCFYEGM